MRVTFAHKSSKRERDPKRILKCLANVPDKFTMAELREANPDETKAYLNMVGSAGVQLGYLKRIRVGVYEKVGEVNNGK